MTDVYFMFNYPLIDQTHKHPVVRPRASKFFGTARSAGVAAAQLSSWPRQPFKKPIWPKQPSKKIRYSGRSSHSSSMLWTIRVPAALSTQLPCTACPWLVALTSLTHWQVKDSGWLLTATLPVLPRSFGFAVRPA